MNFIFVLFALTLIYLSIYIYYQWSFKYWKRRNTPFIKPTFPFGNIRNPIRGGLRIGESFYDIYKEFKLKNIPYGGVFIGPFPNLFMVDLDLIKTIWTKDWRYFMSQGHAVDDKVDTYSGFLFFLDGEKWSETRPKLTSLFTSGRLKSMFPNVLKCGDSLSEYIHNICLENKLVNVRNTFQLYTGEVLGNCTFGLRCNNFENPKSGFIKAGQMAFAARPGLAFRLFLSYICPALITLIKLNFFPNVTTNFLRKIVDDVITYRETSPEKRNDFMQVLLDLKAAMALSEDQVSAQAIGLFAAGFETSASTMTFCLYELARRPDLQAKIREEIQECLNGGQLTYHGITEMKYLDNVINETLRFYPIAGILQRRCTNDYTLPNGTVLKKDTMVVISQLGLQRDEEYYPDPDKFDPERFSNDTIKRSPVYMPFGDGPRICLGKRFALMQIKVGLISALKDHEFIPDESLKYPIEFEPNAIFLAPKNDVLLKVKKV